MKNMIVAAEKNRKIQRPLAEKVDKAAMAKVAKVASAINIGNKYWWASGNDYMGVVRNFGLTSVKKY